mmetsp:Transcript_93152/g.208129  ORF Transcript_93152/g.208129 Transcript_93152/m.208129 type:complete len:132 (+) Transcript_93152:167-562(+)
MSPDWERLGEAWRETPDIVIGDVDCTSEEGRPVCEKQGVEAYPTLKFFTHDTGREGKEYRGRRSFEQMNFFVQEFVAEAWSNLDVAGAAIGAGVLAGGIVFSCMMAGNSPAPQGTVKEQMEKLKRGRWKTD